MGEPNVPDAMRTYFALPSVPYSADRLGLELPLDPEVMISVAKAFRDLADNIWHQASEMMWRDKRKTVGK